MITKIYIYQFWTLFIGDGEFCQEFLKKHFLLRQQYFLLLDEDNKNQIEEHPCL